MPSGQETEWAYSTPLHPHEGHLPVNFHDYNIEVLAERAKYDLFRQSWSKHHCLYHIYALNEKPPRRRRRLWWKGEGQEIAIPWQTAPNSQQRRLRVLNISILTLNPSEWEFPASNFVLLKEDFRTRRKTPNRLMWQLPPNPCRIPWCYCFWIYNIMNTRAWFLQRFVGLWF